MRVLLILLLTSACAPLPEAPGELDELGGYLFQHWDDEPSMQSGIRSFDANLVNLDFDAERPERSFELTALTEEHVAGVDNPEDVNLDAMVGVALGRRSSWEPVWHARLATMVDQAPGAAPPPPPPPPPRPPRAGARGGPARRARRGPPPPPPPRAPHYARDFVDPTDPACFPEQECGSIITLNDILKSNALYTVRIDMWKNFRWVDVLDEDGHDTGRDAIVAKVWTPESYEGEQGNTWIYQSYAIDVWLETEDEGPIRLQYNWSEINLTDDEDVIRGTVRLSLDQLMERTDEYIGEAIAD